MDFQILQKLESTFVRKYHLVEGGVTVELVLELDPCRTGAEGAAFGVYQTEVTTTTVVNLK